MIIRRLNLHPFAGVSNSNFEFQPGINVVFGPNEAGKSTLVNALRTVLLEPTDYRKKKWDDELLRFVPNGGGDTFRVTLEFEQLGAPHKVSKQWGSLKRSEMQLPNGQLISSSADVEIRLAELLSLKQGTWDNVLFAHQNHLSETLAHLAGDGPEKTDLAGILRSACSPTAWAGVTASIAPLARWSSARRPPRASPPRASPIHITPMRKRRGGQPLGGPDAATDQSRTSHAAPETAGPA